MKSRGSLLPQIGEPDNLRSAFHKAARGKRGRVEVQLFADNLGENLAKLRADLLAGTPDIGHYRFFTVRDPKRREICAASFAERVLHHAVMNVCEPVLERYAIYDTYACRKGKGSRLALLRAQQFSRQYPWYLKLDIRKYFDSIDHRFLLQLLSGLFRERPLQELFAAIIATYRTGPGRGLPIGNLISQHCANAYLGPLDHWLVDELGVGGYLRYMDDFVIFARNKGELRRLLPQLRGFLADRLALELKDNIQLNRSVLGMPFLGYRLYPGRVELGSDSKRRFIRKLRQYEATWARGVWDERQLAVHIEPLVEFTRFADAAPFRRAVLRRHGAFP